MRRLCLVIVILSACLTAAQADAAGTKRSAALQLYQEGLFQETGTGDLAMAVKIYTQLIKHYPQYRDIAAVSLYHLGLVNEKLGKTRQAKSYYRRIVRKYADQKKLHAQAGTKLDQLAAEATKQKVQPQPTAWPSPMPAITDAGTAPGQAPQVPVKERAERKHFGVGLNTFGVHLRYRTRNDLQLEGKLQSRRDDLLAGARCAFYSDLFPGASLVSWYGGLGYDWVLNPKVRSKYLVGGFIGGEFLLSGTMGIGADIGYYYINEQSDRMQISTTVDGNVSITFYF